MLAELSCSLEAVNDALHVELARDDVRAGDGRGRRPRRRGLPRDRRAARPLRRRPLRRHAARRGRDPRHGGRALHGRLAAGLRDAVRRVLLPVPRPADQPRRPLPLAHAAARWSSRSTIRMPYGGGVRAPELHDDSPEAYYVHTPGREGRDPVDACRREGPARGGDPRPRPGRHPRAEAPLPHARAARCPRASTSSRSGRRALAREGNDLTLVAYGAMVPVAEQAADELAGEASVEVLDLRTLKPLDEERCSPRPRRPAAS